MIYPYKQPKKWEAHIFRASQMDPAPNSKITLKIYNKKESYSTPNYSHPNFISKMDCPTPAWPPNNQLEQVKYLSESPKT